MKEIECNNLIISDLHQKEKKLKFFSILLLFTDFVLTIVYETLDIYYKIGGLISIYLIKVTINTIS